MPAGISIHVGVNRVDPGAYPDFSRLEGCVNDAEAMQALADRVGFQSRLLLDDQATAEAVLGALDDAVEPVGSDGTLLLTYSGHGSIVTGCNPLPPKNRNEACCLFDREVLDRELLARFSRFHAGARIVVVADSCFSGDIVELTMLKRRSRSGRGRLRALTSDQARRVVEHDPARYAAICAGTPSIDPAEIAPSVLLLAAALDDMPAQDGPRHGVFTQALLDAWGDGASGRSYRELHDAIFHQLQGKQRPVILPIGAGPRFETTPAFRIDRAPFALAA